MRLIPEADGYEIVVSRDTLGTLDSKPISEVDVPETLQAP